MCRALLGPIGYSITLNAHMSLRATQEAPWWLTRDDFLHDAQRMVHNARLAKAAGGGYLLREGSHWGACLSKTRAQALDGGPAQPHATLRQIAAFLAEHGGDPEVSLAGLRALLWLIDALLLDKDAPRMMFSGAQKGPHEVGAALAAASRALAGLPSASAPGSAAAADIAAAASWVVRDVVSRGGDSLFFVDPSRHVRLALRAEDDAGAAAAAPRGLLEPAVIARSAAAALTAPWATAEASDAACGALTALAGNWCGPLRWFMGQAARSKLVPDRLLTLTLDNATAGCELSQRHEMARRMGFPASREATLSPKP